MSAKYILPPFCNKSRVFCYFHDFAQYVDSYVETLAPITDFSHYQQMRFFKEKTLAFFLNIWYNNIYIYRTSNAQIGENHEV